MLQLFKKCKLLLLLIVLALNAIGCQASLQSETPTSLPLPFPSVTVTITQTQIHTASATLSPTRTPTPVLPKKTATATPTRTWTPVPRLSPEAALARIKELYVDGVPCALPCWWGITPGQTTWAQARQLLSEVSPEYGPYYSGILPRYDYSFEVPVNFEPLGYGFIEPSLYVRDEIVVAVGTSTGWIHRDFDYSFANLLVLLGQPDEIWIKYSPTEADFQIEYSLTLFYQVRGILLRKSGEAKLRDNTLVICPLKDQHSMFPLGITLYTPDITDSYEHLRELLHGKYGPGEDRYVRLSTITDGFGESEFYELYKNENATECFAVFVK